MAEAESRRRFHHREGSGTVATCDCPIHRDREREPFTAPLGLRFADHVSVEPITQATAADVYAAHHGYMADLPDINLTHHGLYYQGELLGAITYRYPLISRKAVRYGPGGEISPEPLTDDNYRDLPASIRPTARRIIEQVTPGEIAQREIYQGDRFVEAARICIGVRMANFASAALARSQQLFATEQADDDVRFLLTFVRSDYDGAMIRALRDKGWTCTGYTEPKNPGNREQKAIHKRYKWRFLCPIDAVHEQTSLTRWSA